MSIGQCGIVHCPTTLNPCVCVCVCMPQNRCCTKDNQRIRLQNSFLVKVERERERAGRERAGRERRREREQRSGTGCTYSRAVPDAGMSPPIFPHFSLSITMYYITAGIKINKTLLLNPVRALSGYMRLRAVWTDRHSDTQSVAPELSALLKGRQMLPPNGHAVDRGSFRTGAAS